MNQLTAHFSLEELTFSSTAQRLGIDNTPGADILAEPGADIIAALTIAAQGMEQVRASVLNGQPVHVDSGYRCPALNKAVGGAADSAHMLGYAIDFTCAAVGEPIDLVNAIAASGIKFDQLIQEGTWVHISFAPAMRQMILTAHFGPGGTTYSNGSAN